MILFTRTLLRLVVRLATVGLQCRHRHRQEHNTIGLMLGTIYRVTLLTLQVSIHLEVVWFVWTSVITSRVTDNFYIYCLFLYRAIVSAFRCLLVLFHPFISHLLSFVLCLFLSVWNK